MLIFGQKSKSCFILYFVHLCGLISNTLKIWNFWIISSVFLFFSRTQIIYEGPTGKFTKREKLSLWTIFNYNWGFFLDLYISIIFPYFMRREFFLFMTSVWICDCQKRGGITLLAGALEIVLLKKDIWSSCNWCEAIRNQ